MKSAKTTTHTTSLQESNATASEEVLSASRLFDVLTENGKDYTPAELLHDVTESLIDYALQIMYASAGQGECVLQSSIDSFQTMRIMRERLSCAYSMINNNQ